jgi:hypothetical protein
MLPLAFGVHNSGRTALVPRVESGPASHVDCLFMSPSSRYTAMLFDDGSVCLHAPGGPARIAHPRQIIVPSCFECPLTDAGMLALPTDRGMRIVQLPRRQGDAPAALHDISLFDAMLDDMRMAGVYGIVARGAAGGVQRFAIRAHHCPVGNDTVFLATLGNSGARVSELPLPFASVDMIPADPEFQAFDNRVLYEQLDHFVPCEAQVALTAHRVLVRGFVRRDPGQHRTSTLRCYDAATGEPVWLRQDLNQAGDDQWLFGHVVAHGNNFFVSAVPLSALEERGPRAVMENRTAAHLLRLDEDGTELTVWRNVLQPNTPFALSPNGRFCVNLCSTGELAAPFILA